MGSNVLNVLSGPSIGTEMSVHWRVKKRYIHLELKLVNCSLGVTNYKCLLGVKTSLSANLRFIL